MLISAFCILITTIILQTFLNGSRLAQHIANAINNNIRGTISVESVQWPAHQLIKGLLGGDVKVTLRNVTVFDPDNEQIIDAPLVVAHIAPYHINHRVLGRLFSAMFMSQGVGLKYVIKIGPAKHVRNQQQMQPSYPHSQQSLHLKKHCSMLTQKQASYF